MTTPWIPYAWLAKTAKVFADAGVFLLIIYFSLKSDRVVHTHIEAWFTREKKTKLCLFSCWLLDLSYKHKFRHTHIYTDIHTHLMICRAWWPVVPFPVSVSQTPLAHWMLIPRSMGPMTLWPFASLSLLDFSELTCRTENKIVYEKIVKKSI